MRSLKATLIWPLSTILTLMLSVPAMSLATGGARSICEQAIFVSKARLGSLKVDGRIVSYEKFIANPRNITYILLPGIYRGLGKDGEILQILQEKKINYVAIQFSAHIDSQILSYKEKTKEIDAISFDEMLKEIQGVVAENSIQQPQLVSLSYSDALVSLIKKSNKNKDAYVISTAPMGDVNESDQSSKQVDDSLKMMSAFNPFLGVVYGATKETAFRTYWAGVVMRFKDLYPELADLTLFNRTVTSYVALAKAAEGYNILNQDFSKGPKRVFILAGHEEQVRVSLQFKAIRQYKEQTGEWPLIYWVQEAGHVVPVDQPVAMVSVLQDIPQRMKNRKAKDPFFASVTNDGQIIWLDNAAAEGIVHTEE